MQKPQDTLLQFKSGIPADMLGLIYHNIYVKEEQVFHNRFCAISKVNKYATACIINSRKGIFKGHVAWEFKWLDVMQVSNTTTVKDGNTWFQQHSHKIK